MSMTRTPIKLQVKTRSSLQSASAPLSPTVSHTGRRNENRGGEPEKQRSCETGKAHVSCDSASRKEEYGKKNETATTPDEKGEPKEKGVGKLDSSAYTPFGSIASVSRSSSDISSDASSDSAICQGGPGKQVCGNPVTDDDQAVQCDCCKLWFHTKCQTIPKLAHDALVKFRCLSWLCYKCKKRVRGQSSEQNLPPSSSGTDVLKTLESTVQGIADSVREHMKMIAQSLKEQEKAANDNTRLLQHVYRDQNSQRTSYADMVRGSCEQVVKEVGAKIDALPSHPDPNSKGSAESVNTMSKVFDSFMDKERRKLNVVVHNLPEQEGSSLAERMENDQLLFKEVIKEGLNLIIRPTKAFRVGKRIGDRPRLLIVTLESTDVKAELLRMASQLRHLSKWKRIYVTPDLTKKDRDDAKRLRDELATRKQAGEENLVIRRGRIVRLAAESQLSTRPSSENAPASDCQNAPGAGQTGSTNQNCGESELSPHHSTQD